MHDIAEYYDSRIGQFITLGLAADAVEQLELDAKFGVGYTLKTLAAGIWAVTHANSFMDGLSTIIMAGGDADTNGAVAGSMLGARFGMRDIPQHLIDELRWKTYLYRVGYELFAKVEPIPNSQDSRIDSPSAEYTLSQGKTPTQYVLILDDNDTRLTAFIESTTSMGIPLQVITWKQAPTMLAELSAYLPHTRLISLDHDLYAPDQDPGCGQDIVDHLLGYKPCCPIIIHSCNETAAWKMYNNLHFAGWAVEVILHTDQDNWYQKHWVPVVKRMLNCAQEQY
jgi:hypothetical protein